MHKPSLALPLVALALVVSPALAHAAPTVLAVQGRLATVANLPVADGVYGLALALYANANSTEPLYLENFIGVEVKSGIFGLELGVADPSKKLDDSVLMGATSLWIGLKIAADPEMPRTPIRETPFAVQARHATVASTLSCSGCVTGAMLAPAAIQAQHVDFAYAGSSSKGGPATTALAADEATHAAAADLATKATGADEAMHALTADAAKAADTATSADVAKDVQCTGCIGAADVAPGFVADLVSGGQLAAVAKSGGYGDLGDKPDLSVFGLLAKPNTWADAQTFGKDVQFNKHQALLMRLHNADKDPVTCDSTATGLLYYNTVTSSLMVCNGTKFQTFAMAMPIGSKTNPGTSCQHILTATGEQKSGLYWINGASAPPADAFTVYCDQTTDGGGWTKIESAAWGFFFNGGNYTSYNASDPMQSNYSIVGKRDLLVAAQGWYRFRFVTGAQGSWIAGPVAKQTIWEQQHDPFTATSAGNDYKFISGEQSATCGGFNGLHAKYQGYSFTSDPDSGDSSGCWWMQVVPSANYDGKGYLDGYGGSGHYHQWQSLWMR